MRAWNEDPQERARLRKSSALVPTDAAVAETLAREAKHQNPHSGAGSKVKTVKQRDLLGETQHTTVAEGNAQDATAAVAEGKAQDTTAAVAGTGKGGAEGKAAGAAAASNASPARSSCAQNEECASSPEVGDRGGSDEAMYS